MGEFKMIGSISGFSDDRLSLYIDFKVPHNFKGGESVSVSVKRSKRTIDQNSFYWSYLEWCILHGLKDKGHFSPEALHSDIKIWIKETHGVEFKGDFSTADLGIMQFAGFFNYVDRELMGQFFEISTYQFHQDYTDYKEWLSYQDDQEAATFRVFLEERAK
jgi:hypothetical protein